MLMSESPRFVENQVFNFLMKTILLSLLLLLFLLLHCMGVGPARLEHADF